jgi:hypothetical protein
MTPTQLPPIKTRVQHGAQYLDEILPGWADTIDLDGLDLESACDCVLGQLAIDIVPNLTLRSTPYTQARSHLGIGVDDAVALGFNTYGDYGYLTRMWRNLIIQRREQVNA